MLRNDGLVQLQNGSWTALLSPEIGGSVLALAKDGAHVLRASASKAVTDPLDAACYPCAPWFGRLYGGFSFRGRRWPLAPTHPAEPDAALHGLVWTRPWTITAATASAATLTCAAPAEANGFPFAFAAEQTFALRENGLHQTLRVRNEAEVPAPFGLGLHPFFPRSADARLHFAARRLWCFRAGGGGDAWPVPPALDFTSGASLPAQTQDMTFLEFGGRVVIETGGETVTVTSDAPHLHLYAPAEGDFFCLEPVTHPPGAFGDEVLEPGATIAVSLQIEA